MIPTIARPRKGAQRDRWLKPFGAGVAIQWGGAFVWTAGQGQGSHTMPFVGVLLSVIGSLVVLRAACVLLSLPRTER